MPAQKTERLEARITPETAAQVEDLSRIWGIVKPLNQSDVATEAIKRAWLAETLKRTEIQTKKKKSRVTP